MSYFDIKLKSNGLYDSQDEALHLFVRKLKLLSSERLLLDSVPPSCLDDMTVIVSCMASAFCPYSDCVLKNLLLFRNHSHSNYLYRTHFALGLSTYCYYKFGLRSLDVDVLGVRKKKFSEMDCVSPGVNKAMATTVISSLNTISKVLTSIE